MLYQAVSNQNPVKHITQSGDYHFSNNLNYTLNFCFPSQKKKMRIRQLSVFSGGIEAIIIENDFSSLIENLFNIIFFTYASNIIMSW